MSFFDPYHKWLGIPPDQQPASHYRLLGIEDFETDPDVIEAAAERQTVFLRTFQTGPNPELAERLLNEIAVAKICLLDKKEKEVYDTRLSVTDDDQPIELPPNFAPSFKPPLVIIPSSVPTQPIAADPQSQLPQLSGKDPSARLETELEDLQIDEDSHDRAANISRGRARRNPKKSPASPKPLKTLISVVLGGIAGIGVAIVSIWFIWDRDPFGVFSDPIAAKPAKPEILDTPRKTVLTTATERADEARANAKKLATEQAATKATMEKVAEEKLAAEQAAAKA